MSQQTRSRSTNPFYSALYATGISTIYYPVVRLQSMLQMQYGYSSLNPELKFRGVLSGANHAIGNSMKGLFTGVSFAASYTGIKYLIFTLYNRTVGYSTFDSGVQGYIHSAVATFLATAAAYPFELMQNRSASIINSTNPTQVLSYQETIKTFTNSSNWIGYPLAYTRYLLLFSTIQIYASGCNPLISAVLSFCAVPIDVVRRNFIMTQWENRLPYKNVLECTKYLVETHGYRSLVRGMILYPEIYLVYFVLLAPKKNDI